MADPTKDPDNPYFPPSAEMRKVTCPAWYFHVVDYNKKPDCKKCSNCTMFFDCVYFKTKDECWARWDKEIGDNDNEQKTIIPAVLNPCRCGAVPKLYKTVNDEYNYIELIIWCSKCGVRSESYQAPPGDETEAIDHVVSKWNLYPGKRDQTPLTQEEETK